MGLHVSLEFQFALGKAEKAENLKKAGLPCIMRGMVSLKDNLNDRMRGDVL
jgi:hypothetical protein